MNMNDPFGFGKIQNAIQQTQKAVASVNTVANKLSQDVGDSKALESLANATKAATDKLEQIEVSVDSAKEKVADISATAQSKKEELSNTTFLSEVPSSETKTN